MSKLKERNFVRLENSEIHRYINLLEVNNHKIWNGQEKGFKKDDDAIILNNEGNFLSVKIEPYSIGLDVCELSKHDWVCAAIGLEEGDALDDTIERKIHLSTILIELGVNCCDLGKEILFKHLESYPLVFFKGQLRGTFEEFVIKKTPYSEWCKKLGIKEVYPDKTKDERYPMCADQPAQIDCRLSECVFHSGGSCNNVSPAITLNPSGQGVCWSKTHKETLETPPSKNNESPVSKMETTQNIITLLDGATVDLTKPIEVLISKDEYYAIDEENIAGFHNKNLIVWLESERKYWHYKLFRNTPEPEEYKPNIFTEALKQRENDMIALQDGSLVDFTKPIQYRYFKDKKWLDKPGYKFLRDQFIGRNDRKGTLVFYDAPADKLHECYLRNTPEKIDDSPAAEFKEGDPVWFNLGPIHKPDTTWCFGWYLRFDKVHCVVDQMDGVNSHVEVKPAFNPDGTPNFPPFLNEVVEPDIPGACGICWGKIKSKNACANPFGHMYTCINGHSLNSLFEQFKKEQ